MVPREVQMLVKRFPLPHPGMEAHHQEKPPFLVLILIICAAAVNHHLHLHLAIAGHTKCEKTVLPVYQILPHSDHTLGDREYELRLGNSFHSRGGPKTAFHTIRYDFKPASVDTTRPAELVVGEKNEVTVTVPHVQDNSNTIYRGSKRSCTKEFILVVDKDKKTFTLERIESTIPQLKKVRSSRQAPKSVKLPVTPSTATLSKSQKSKTKKKTVDQKASKLDSPVKNTSTAAISPEETSIKPDDVGPVAAVSDSSLSSSSNSSDSEKDENEDGDEFDEKDVEKLNSLMTGQMVENDTLSKKEGFNTLCEDLQLSESGSDSD